MILDQLYKPSTVTQILSDLANLQSPDADYFVDRWDDLVNGVVDTSGLFLEHTSGGYRFPIPDNDKYSIPNQNISAPLVFPFDGVTPINTPVRVDVLKQAIN